MSLDRHMCFDVFGDVSACVVGTIGIVDGDRYVDLSRLEVVLLDEASVDSAARATTVQQALCAQGLRYRYGVQDDVHHEVVRSTFLAVDNNWWFTELIEPLPRIFSPEV